MQKLIDFLQKSLKKDFNPFKNIKNMTIQPKTCNEVANKMKTIKEDIDYFIEKELQQISQMEIDAKKDTDEVKEDQEILQIDKTKVESSSMEKIQTTRDKNWSRMTRSQISKENSLPNNLFYDKNSLKPKPLKRKSVKFLVRKNQEKQIKKSVEIKNQSGVEDNNFKTDVSK